MHAEGCEPWTFLGVLALEGTLGEDVECLHCTFSTTMDIVRTDLSDPEEISEQVQLTTCYEHLEFDFNFVCSCGYILLSYW